MHIANHNNWHPEIEVERGFIEVVGVKVSPLNHLHNTVEVVSVVLIPKEPVIRSYKGPAERYRDEEQPEECQRNWGAGRAVKVFVREPLHAERPKPLHVLNDLTSGVTNFGK